ncbi:hypothetical protein GN956_G20376 [Arapaima gigas]
MPPCGAVVPPARGSPQARGAARAHLSGSRRRRRRHVLPRLERVPRSGHGGCTEADEAELNRTLRQLPCPQRRLSLTTTIIKPSAKWK